MGKMSLQEQDQLKEQLKELINNARPGSLKKAMKIISKGPRASVPSICSPRPISLAKETTWRPKHLEQTKEAMALISEGVGVRSAPYSVARIGGAWPNKFFCSDISQRLMIEKSEPLCGKVATSTWSLAVASIAARLVEESNAIKDEDKAFTGMELKMQRAAQDAGWDRIKTRGSGIVFSDESKPLFDAAVKRLAEKLVKM